LPGMRHPVPTPIYHITHVDNLTGILSSGGLFSKSALRVGVPQVDMSHFDLQERRLRCVVTCGPGGNLHNYVPFYFAPRSPMLYAIYRNNVAGYRGGQTPIVYLCSSVQRVRHHALPFVFSDGHPIMALSQFYERVDDLSRVDWAIMASDYWNDTIEHPKRKQLRQAEFLVYHFFPWDCVMEIVVRSVAIQGRVEALLVSHPRNIRRPVRVEARWYF